MKIGNRIKQRRLELGLSVDELAKRLNKNRATVYRYESNDIENFPTTVLEPLAKALQTTPAYLMGWELSDEEIADVFQEGIEHEIISKMCTVFPKKEVIHFENYIKLDENNKNLVNNYTEKLLSLQQMEYEVNAAHARTDIEIPEDVDTSDDDIMDDENF